MKNNKCVHIILVISGCQFHRFSPIDCKLYSSHNIFNCSVVNGLELFFTILMCMYEKVHNNTDNGK